MVNDRDSDAVEAVRDMNIPVFHAVREHLEKNLDNARSVRNDAQHKRNAAQDAYDDACHQLMKLEDAYAALTGLQTTEKRDVDINDPLQTRRFTNG